MDVYEALYTTRAMRRVTTEPVPMDVQAKILDAAIRAPSGGNTQGWRFLLVDDPEVKGQIGPIYREAMSWLWANYYAERIAAAHADPENPESKSVLSVQKSAQWLADHFEEVPLYLFGFSNDGGGSSLYPAVWSAQLAARAEGVGSSLTQVLAFQDARVKEILGVPAEGPWQMGCCVSFGYPTGRWGVAGHRQPVHEVAFRNQWGEPVGFEVPDPLWPDA